MCDRDHESDVLVNRFFFFSQPTRSWWAASKQYLGCLVTQFARKCLISNMTVSLEKEQDYNVGKGRGRTPE